MFTEEIAAIIYSQVFNFPLNLVEAKLWKIATVKSKNINLKIKSNKNLREILRKRTAQKMVLSTSVSKSLAKIPTIVAVLLTGSVAAGNPKKDADIDLMIITAPNTLWLTRLVVVLYLKWQRLYKKIVCPNIFLDLDHLKIEEKNLYTAHEILQTKCLIDKGNFYQRFILENKWTSKYLPNAYDNRKKDSGCDRNDVAVIPTDVGVLLVFEFFAFIIQYFYQLPKQTNERIGWGFAFFHPNQMTEKVLSLYRQKLSKLGIMEIDET